MAYLCARHKEMLRLAAAEWTFAETARVMGMTPGSVKTTMASLYHRLDAPNRSGAIHRAASLGIIPIPPNPPACFDKQLALRYTLRLIDDLVVSDLVVKELTND